MLRNLKRNHYKMSYKFRSSELIIKFSKILKNFKCNYENVIDSRVKMINKDFNNNIKIE